jgi:hypothetical protein
MVWGDKWPNWQDIGKRVELTLESGVKVVGKLTYEDMTPGPDEAPIFEVELDDGSKIGFVDHEDWRFVTPSRESAT